MIGGLNCLHGATVDLLVLWIICANHALLVRNGEKCNRGYATLVGAKWYNRNRMPFSLVINRILGNYGNFWVS